MAEMNEYIIELRKQKEHLKKGGNKEVQEKLHKRGMLLARERIEKFLDPGSFVELDMFVTHHCNALDMPQTEIPYEGIITGYGKVGGRPVFLYSQDFSAMSGTLGRWGAKKLTKMMDLAYARQAPIVGLNHSAGARFQELLRGDGGSGHGFGEQFYKIALYSGVIPQISLVFGDNAGGGVYGPGMSDFVIATRESTMFISGPAVVRKMIGEKITPKELGGAEMHAAVSGCVHVLAENDEDCLKKGQEILSFLPSSCYETPPVVKVGDDPKRLCRELEKVVPANLKKVYDIHQVIRVVVDNSYFFEIHRDYAKNIVVGFARFDGIPVGIVANNPMYHAGTITVAAAEKAARFIRFCDLFNIPIIYLVDSPAYMIGSEQERAGILQRGTKLLFATIEATVPKIAILVRHCVAASDLAMGSLSLGGDLVYAWPIAEMSGLAPESLAEIIFTREIREAENPEEVRARRVEDCKREIGDIYAAASWQNVNDIIEPAETRTVIIRALDMTKGKIKMLPKKKYSNIPI